MSEIEITHLEKRTLAYLGLKGEPDAEQLEMVRSAIKDASRIARARFAYRYLDLNKDEEGHYYCDAPFDISYQSLQKMFAKGDSDSLCILVSTLGEAIDRKTSQLSERDPSKMLLLDAAANALIEEETNAFQAKLGLRDQTFRFAPGYGDVPLSMQREIFDLMPEIKNIGIILDDSNFMHPFKSMTGLIGFKGE